MFLKYTARKCFRSIKYWKKKGNTVVDFREKTIIPPASPKEIIADKNQVKVVQPKVEEEIIPENSDTEITPRRSRQRSNQSSLSNILSSENQAVEEKLSKEAPSQEVVDKLWKQFLEESKDTADSFFLSYAVTTQPIWKSPDTIFFKLSSNIAQGTLSNNKSNFIPYFKDRLQVENLQFESEVEVIEEENKPVKVAYSFQERLSDLQNENPNINLFIEKFGLKITGNE